jgi:hypothetical protein
MSARNEVHVERDPHRYERLGEQLPITRTHELVIGRSPFVYLVRARAAGVVTCSGTAMAE